MDNVYLTNIRSYSLIKKGTEMDIKKENNNNNFILNNLIDNIFKWTIELSIKLEKINYKEVDIYNINSKSMKKKLKIIYSLIKKIDNIETVNLLFNKQNYIQDLESTVHNEQIKRIRDYSFHLQLKNQIKWKNNQLNNCKKKQSNNFKLNQIINNYSGIINNFTKNITSIDNENITLKKKFKNLKFNQKLINENLIHKKNLETKMTDITTKYNDKLRKIIKFYSNKLIIFNNIINKIANSANLLKTNKLDKATIFQKYNSILRNCGYIVEHISQIEAFNQKYSYDKEIKETLNNYFNNKERLLKNLYFKTKKNEIDNNNKLKNKSMNIRNKVIN